jgi:exportin-2 (importin alpha re-exporter)
LEILKLVASSDGGIDPAVRQAAAVHFKNLIKKGWDPKPDDDDDDHDHDPADAFILSPNDRVTIKSHLVQLMCTTPPQIQVQLSEAISLIAASDFPDRWTNLLPELVQQFSTPNPEILVGVLKTANSIFKSFRHVGRSNELYRSILVTLHAVQAPLLALFKNLGQAVDATVAAATVDKKLLAFQLEALRLVCRIFYSLNFQDLPEFFEDHMGEWMADFAAHLQRQLPPAALLDPNEEVEPSPLDKLQAAIITNLMLYAEKDEEPFLVYLPNFTTLVWNLLVAVTPFPKHDALATTSIRFLSSLVEKLMHRSLFEDPAVLQQIVGRIVVPNLLFRESDEERFEDDPREFLVTEVEGSDSETRRRCSQNLLRAMCRQFESETTAICVGHINTMLHEFAANPDAQWKAKDAAVRFAHAL